MKLSEYIAKLQEIESAHGGDLPVCLAIYSHGCSFESEEEAEHISIGSAEYYRHGSTTALGKHVNIGTKETS